MNSAEQDMLRRLDDVLNSFSPENINARNAGSQTLSREPAGTSTARSSGSIDDSTSGDSEEIYDVDDDDDQDDDEYESDDDDDDDYDDSDSGEDEFQDHYAVPGSNICRFCEDLLLLIIEGDRDKRLSAPEHYEWFQNMNKSSRTCCMCLTLIEAAEDYLAYSPDVMPQDRNMVLRSYDIYQSCLTRPYCNQERLKDAGIIVFTICMGQHEDDPKFQFLVMTDVRQGGPDIEPPISKGLRASCSIPQRAIWSDKTSIGLSERLPVLHQWLTDCSAQHTACRARMLEREKLPTRLIDLGNTQNMADFDPKLVLTVQLDQLDLKYTTLSHRWGDEQPNQTDTGNVDSHLKSIFNLMSPNASSIPKTFDDAFQITRALGIRYIWIDSLCIIQDDLSDWQQEALKMADVYRGSFLNIAAIDSPDCHGGCSLDLDPGNVTISSPRMKGASARVRTLPPSPVDVSSSKLNTRGWVFQELMLAPRVLYCGQRQFYWQCTEKVYSEDGYIDHHIALNIPGDRQRPAHSNDWRSCVSDFSRRYFTKPSDRLPALHGVLQHYHKETGHSFLLGLSENVLVGDLAWRTRQVEFNFAHSFPVERSKLENVPSWSWLSLQVDQHPGGILYFPPLDNTDIMTKIEEASVSWESEPLFSKILSTKLIVKGPLQKMGFEYDNIRRRLHPQGGEERYDLDTSVIRLDSTLSGISTWDSMRDYWCLQLETAEVRVRHISTFLVLEEEDEGNHETPRFRRIGCGRMNQSDVNFDNPVIQRLELI